MDLLISLLLLLLLQIQDNWPSVLFAMAGGVGLSFGNLATQYALAFVGLSVTEVTTASITVVIGAFTCYAFVATENSRYRCD